MDIIKKLDKLGTYTVPEQNEIRWKAMAEIERLREVVMLLVAYDEHDEEIQKGAVMWDVLIEAAHAALKEKE